MKTEPMSFALRSKLIRALALFVLPAAVFVAAPPASCADAASSRVHALFNVELSDKYLTPRGMIVQDKGMTTQVLFLALVDLYHGAPDDPLSSITLVPGFWNDYATRPVAIHNAVGSRTTHWIEIDPIFGLSFGLGKNFKLDVTYTEFGMQILDIGTSQHLETKLSYDDSAVLGAFALHPYLTYWKELEGKATAAANFNIPESYYFEIGVAPSVTSGAVKFEFPLRALLPNANFYGETFAKKSTVGLYELGVKAGGAATFMPPGYGHWSWHVGIRYVNFVDKNLRQLATSGGFGQPTDNTSQVYCGLSSFF